MLVTAASSKFTPFMTLLRKYFDGFCIDSPTRALAEKCRHDGIRFHFTHRVTDDSSMGEVTLKEFRARLDRFAVTFGQIIVEDRVSIQLSH